MRFVQIRTDVTIIVWAADQRPTGTGDCDVSDNGAYMVHTCWAHHLIRRCVRNIRFPLRLDTLCGICSVHTRTQAVNTWYNVINQLSTYKWHRNAWARVRERKSRRSQPCCTLSVCRGMLNVDVGSALVSAACWCFSSFAHSISVWVWKVLLISWDTRVRTIELLAHIMMIGAGEYIRMHMIEKL